MQQGEEKMALREAIRTYHDLLTDELAAESQGQLNDQMQMRGLYFGTRPLCTVLRPRFLTPDQYIFLRQAIRPFTSSPSPITRAIPSRLMCRWHWWTWLC